MDAIIEVFKRREDWTEAEARRNLRSRLKRRTIWHSSRWVAIRSGWVSTKNQSAKWSNT